MSNSELNLPHPFTDHQLFEEIKTIFDTTEQGLANSLDYALSQKIENLVIQLNYEAGGVNNDGEYLYNQSLFDEYNTSKKQLLTKYLLVTSDYYQNTFFPMPSLQLPTRLESLKEEIETSTLTPEQKTYLLTHPPGMFPSQNVTMTNQYVPNNNMNNTNDGLQPINQGGGKKRKGKTRKGKKHSKKATKRRSNKK